MPQAPSPAAPLILASTSPYRAQLLARLQIPFETRAPGVDEAAASGEAPAGRAARLALAKAQAVAAGAPGRWVLGSDQVLDLEGEQLDKPGSAAAGAEQLRKLSGRTATFLTAVALVGEGAPRQALDRTRVTFRVLSPLEIARYTRSEPAFDCAGSFKCEGLGITLCERIATDDPTALIGLPLIAVRRLLAAAGCAIP